MSYEELSHRELVEALKEIEEQFEKATSERDKYEDIAKKTKADLENYRKKQDERKDRWQQEAKQDLAEDLIEVIDNLERALMAADEETAVVKGVEMVNKQLYDALNSEGLKVIEAGEEFNPEIHKAVETKEHDEYAPKTILEQKRKGYIFNDKVLRPAEVVVSKKPEKED